MSDPNRADQPQYIVDLLGRVITVSLKFAAYSPKCDLHSDNKNFTHPDKAIPFSVFCPFSVEHRDRECFAVRILQERGRSLLHTTQKI